MNTPALVIVDAQRAFLDTACGVLSTRQKAFCVPGVQAALDVAERGGWTIVHVGTRHDGEASLPAHQKRRGDTAYCVPDTAGIEFVVEPASGHAVVYKSWYSAFESDLEEHLGGIDTVVWAGVAIDCCVSQSAFDADRKGYRNVVPFQAVSSTTREAYVAGLIALAKSAAEVIDVAKLTTDLAHDLGGLSAPEITAQAGAWYAEQERQADDIAD